MMDYFPFYVVNETDYHYSCIPYPTFAQLLARLEAREPHFGWENKFTRPLVWLFGNVWPLDAITIDRLDSVLPETLCIVFDIPPAWVLDFCEATLLALEQARVQAVQQHLDGIQPCLQCDGHMMVSGPVDDSALALTLHIESFFQQRNLV
ncbi:hypothetical protein JVT61DRAFT_11225 [Boletus reticuloceps]|uniref:Uncharacterized protein n=1 Tax=Boletus reticuloceps TaxID=495285 RepID=A0A8I3A496_9AGAM|nr:hypothetical protein JVT61DRAFT_11225 [Boletus reticuloceps]